MKLQQLLTIMFLSAFLVAGFAPVNAHAEEKKGLFGIFNSSKDGSASKPVYIDTKPTAGTSGSRSKPAITPYTGKAAKSTSSGGSFADAMRATDSANKQNSEVAAAKRQLKTDQVIAQDVARLSAMEKQYEKTGKINMVPEPRKMIYQEQDKKTSDTPRRLFNLR